MATRVNVREDRGVSRLVTVFHKSVDEASKLIRSTVEDLMHIVVSKADSTLFDPEVVRNILTSYMNVGIVVDILSPYASPQLAVLKPVSMALYNLFQALASIDNLCRKPAKGRGVCKLTIKTATVKNVAEKLSNIKPVDAYGEATMRANGYLKYAMASMKMAINGFARLTGKTLRTAEEYEYWKYNVTFSDVLLDIVSLLEWADKELAKLKEYSVRKVNDIEIVVHPEADVDLVNAVVAWAETAKILHKLGFINSEDYKALCATVHGAKAFIVLSEADRTADLEPNKLKYHDADLKIVTGLEELLNLAGIKARITIFALEAEFPKEKLVTVAKLLAITPSLDRHIADLSPDEVEKYMLSIACEFIEEYDRVCMRP